MKTILSIAAIALWIASETGHLHPAVSVVFMIVNVILTR